MSQKNVINLYVIVTSTVLNLRVVIGCPSMIIPNIYNKITKIIVKNLQYINRNVY